MDAVVKHYTDAKAQGPVHFEVFNKKLNERLEGLEGLEGLDLSGLGAEKKDATLK